jgi:5-methylcytosine-specific restriction endonuclease McrA
MFAKIFAQIYDSSIVEDVELRVTFMDMLILADPNGVVDMTHEAIARRTNRPIETVRRTIAQLESPDPHSRTPDHEGRRIARLDDHRDWGWFILNYTKFRLIESNEQRREKTRERVRRFRERGGGDPDKWNATRARILKLDNYTCGYCGGEADEVDHIVPKARITDGTDGGDENLTACCKSCNSSKQNRTPEEWGIPLKNNRVTHRVTQCFNLVTQCQPSNGKEKEKEKKKESTTSVGADGSATSPKADDSVWLESLKTDAAYQGIDVAVEWAKMTRWCDVNRRQPTRRRFINWLNRCDRPVSRNPERNDRRETIALKVVTN